MSTKTALICALLTAASIAAADWAVWYLGVNTNGISPSFPVKTRSMGAAPDTNGASAILTDAQYASLVSTTQPSFDAWQSATRFGVLVKTEQALAQFNAASARLDAWQEFLGTPSAPGSNFVNIAQASQWARESTWLMERLLKMTRSLYDPASDTGP